MDFAGSTKSKTNGWKSITGKYVSHKFTLLLYYIEVNRYLKEKIWWLEKKLN